MTVCRETTRSGVRSWVLPGMTSLSSARAGRLARSPPCRGRASAGVRADHRTARTAPGPQPRTRTYNAQ